MDKIESAKELLHPFCFGFRIYETCITLPLLYQNLHFHIDFSDQSAHRIRHLVLLWYRVNKCLPRVSLKCKIANKLLEYGKIRGKASRLLAISHFRLTLSKHLFHSRAAYFRTGAVPGLTRYSSSRVEG